MNIWSIQEKTNFQIINLHTCRRYPFQPFFTPFPISDGPQSSHHAWSTPLHHAPLSWMIAKRTTSGPPPISCCLILCQSHLPHFFSLITKLPSPRVSQYTICLFSNKFKFIAILKWKKIFFALYIFRKSFDSNFRKRAKNNCFKKIKSNF